METEESKDEDDKGYSGKEYTDSIGKYPGAYIFPFAPPRGRQKYFYSMVFT